MGEATRHREGGIQVYSMGLVCMSVCAPKSMPREEVERRANLAQPTGISSRWKISDENFRTGQENGFDAGECGRHWLLNC